MDWSIKNKDKYSIYTPLISSEERLIYAIRGLDFQENKILDLSNIYFTEEIIGSILKIYEAHIEKKISCVVVINKENLEDYEELFLVVPSISEAIDYIYMEELERNF